MLSKCWVVKKERGKFVSAGMEWSAEYFGTWKKKMRFQTIKLYASFVVKGKEVLIWLCMHMCTYAYISEKHTHLYF